MLARTTTTSCCSRAHYIQKFICTEIFKWQNRNTKEYERQILIEPQLLAVAPPPFISKHFTFQHKYESNKEQILRYRGTNMKV